MPLFSHRQIGFSHDTDHILVGAEDVLVGVDVWFGYCLTSR